MHVSETQRPASKEGAVGSARDHQSSRPSVLVIDDDVGMLDACTQVLARDGFEVIPVSDGTSALALSGQRAPDVMIVDLKMPGMSGEDFLRRAKESDPEAVVIVITGYPSLGSAVEVMKAGAYDFLCKPFSAEQLRVVARRAMEKRMLAVAVAAGAREKKRMRDNFIAMVSHQLKSPAASLKECLDVALQCFAEQRLAKCKDLLERADAKSQLLLDLMDDWLTLDRAESGSMMASYVPVDLCSIAEQAVAAAREGPEHNDVEVQVKAETRPCSTRGDEEALRELFVNLVDNAMRYTRDGGSVNVLVAQEGEEAVVTVEDTGPGIPPEEVEVIFEPFFRGARAKKMHGTGLGLPIAKQIVEAHGGRIEVRTAPGRGSAFRVFLPLGGPRESAARSEPEKNEKQGCP